MDDQPHEPPGERSVATAPAEAAAALARAAGDETLARFALVYLRRPAEARGAGRSEPDTQSLLAEARGAFDLAARRDGAPAAVRAFTPDRERDGYEAPGSVLETNTDDLPFLVDSISAELHARGLGIRRVVHPIVGLRRGSGPTHPIEAVEHPRDAPRESVMHFELDRHLAPEELADLEDAARHVFAAVRVIVADFAPLKAAVGRMRQLAGDDPEREAFLDWLCDGNFVFLGYREDVLTDDPGRPPDPVPGSGLGLLRQGRGHGAVHAPAHDPPSPPLGPDAEPGETLMLTSTHAFSPVHRHDAMDAILVRASEADGTVHEARLLGLFTSSAHREPASTTPLLRRKLREILEAEDLIEGSHDAKRAVAIFDGLPKRDLFAAPVGDLRRIVAGLLAAAIDDVVVLGRRAPDGRSAALVIALPRERYSAALRERLRAIVARAHGVGRADVHELFDEDERVLIHLTVRGAGGLPDVDLVDLRRRVVLQARTWRDRVSDELVDEIGFERGHVLLARWLRRLPDSYRATASPVTAAADIPLLERLVTGAADLLVGLHDEPADEGLVRRTRVALYKRGPKVELAQATRLLEHHGLRVIEELPARLHGDDELWVQAFAVLGPDNDPLDLAAVGSRLAESLEAVWRGDTESDTLNRLTVSAGLRWPQIQILRAYRRYRQRIGSRYTESFQNDVITAHPGPTAKLMALFEARFGLQDDGDEAIEAIEGALREEIRADIDAVELLDHDRILRNQLRLIDATVRTNAFRTDRDALAFKLRCADVPAIPQPAPLFEIYVYAADMEGVHLRGARIARGGIRWSERMDYRTEVFGLMRAQMTKNAIIVPAGAKGGFFLKDRPREPEALAAAVRRQYCRYIEALLDVTDNRDEHGAVLTPDGVRTHDEPDAYLVVAADKGTAAFSDVANAIAVRRGFWLGDAFASGGATGYDHKKLGITARGAWESVKRHFRQLGVDPEADPITVVGIGDMSGDVFGNGMLLSRSLRLVAAYDHRHIFLDPAPGDPERAWEERHRLFTLARSSWDDYDRALISEGGGVFPRTVKHVPISPQARAALEIDAEALAPDELIQAILRAPVDLLWNGGIGTPVKASAESHADAADRSCDAIRVDAAELRCRVVGEGGNLGFTQRARVEFARGGGLINADFIDNSAGVDSSDHEVNLKILLDHAVRRERLGRDARDALLAEVTDDVVGHVLYDSFLQAQVIAQEVRDSALRLFAYDDLMEALEEPRILRRRDEALPPSDEIAERRRAGEGLQRPELAVLVAYAKRLLTDELLDSELPDESVFAHELRAYFPHPVVERFDDLIGEHPLRRELVATLVANDVVDALGPTFVTALARELGAHPAEVVRAYWIAREVTTARQRWLEVEGEATRFSDDVARRLIGGIGELVTGVARWYLLHTPGADVGAEIDAASEAFATLGELMPSLRSSRWCEEQEAAAAELVTAGVPEPLARRHAGQRALLHAPDIVTVARASGCDVVEVARAFFALGEALALERLELQVLALPSGTRIQRWAQQALLDDVLDARRLVAQRAIEEAPGAAPSVAVERFLDEREAARRRLSTVSRTIAAEGDGGLAGLALAIRHLRTLAG